MEIVIRGSEPEDAQSYQRIYSDPTVYANTLQLPYPSVAYWRNKLAQNESIGRVSFVAEVEGRVVGDITLFTTNNPRIRHVVGLGIGVDPAFAGRGVGSKLLATGIDYAFNWLAAVRMELEVFTDNERAIGLYRKFGFAAEGVQRQAAFRNGQYCDVMLMAKLK
ncbi:putative acetyltransferase [Gibbsiella quercinecans]|uniref:Acetyltransferase n=1 Tax=Gibbsiella quercinecans TaxID=929813 RepID=A0A250B6C8_9GAMM|nr:GNAT family N-acetyltransferase [Gibbsiella quercinecans]ATA21626.1 acetyltransferase [Gibbsiella quercinecans]RLM06085.1 GNAT family N-acetyltransferase [Gibbsiella quercinecans]RLM06241.1 GNAT family N-acetyltransferase [Gibbsiella quercinecans]TCT88873.1 putative acetyltransferase [Gibbsiella quercinecans]